ncbi:MAG: sulfatase [Opitutae bacterium]|nr:sulfatase [Opitutae bacterium]
MKPLPLFLIAFALAGQASLIAKPLNVLFIFADDHAYQAISAYGSNRNKTPNIDRLAKEGMIFHRAFVTNSICAPSRAVILTGKHSHLNGQLTNGMRFDGEQQTFPKLLQKSGYQTAMIGKWHLKSDPTGFDFWQVLQGQGPYYNPPMNTPDGVKRITGYTTDIITDVTLDWLKNGRDKDKPFFIMSQHKAPHRNWQPGPKHLNKYEGIDLPEPETLRDDYKNRLSPAATQAMTVKNHLSANDLKLRAPGNLTPEQKAKWNAAYDPKNKAFAEAKLEGDELLKWKYQRYVKDYLRCIDSVDENVGRILDYLDKSGLAENTVVIYSSDQGWYLGEHGWYDKRWMYEESFRTPLLARWPGVTKPGSKNHDLVQNLDYAETILDLCGVKAPKDMQGESIVPLLKGTKPKDWRKSLYYHYYEFPGAHSVRRHYGVRTEKHKLIHFYNLDGWELYDLEKDPNELNSVYGKPEYAALTKELKDELERLRKLYQVPEDTRPVSRQKKPKKNPKKK